MSGLSINPYMSVSVENARKLYGVTEEDLKTLNSDGDDKITLKELKNYGFHKNIQLTECFNRKSSGALFAQINNKNSDGSIKSNFSTNFTGGLSPRVDSDAAQSNVGNLFPRLYA